MVLRVKQFRDTCLENTCNPKAIWSRRLRVAQSMTAQVCRKTPQGMCAQTVIVLGIDRQPLPLLILGCLCLLKGGASLWCCTQWNPAKGFCLGAGWECPRLLAYSQHSWNNPDTPNGSFKSDETDLSWHSKLSP